MFCEEVGILWLVPNGVVSVEVTKPYMMDGVGDGSWCQIGFHVCCDGVKRAIIFDMLKSCILPIDVINSMVVMSGCLMCSCFQLFVSTFVLTSIMDLVAFRARL